MESHGSQAWLWSIPLLPLLGSAIAGALHFLTLRARKSQPQASGVASIAALVACVAMLAAFGCAIFGFNELRALGEHERALRSTAHHWISMGAENARLFDFQLGLLLDPLSSTMTLVVTGVGLLIHVYAAGYMKGDPGYAKFFAYLNLFVFAMLMLVLSSSLLGTFIGWEGVGLCSYLLIGFWYEKGWPAEAAQKAFVMNRVGDACFLIGSFLLIGLFGTDPTHGTLDMATIASTIARNTSELEGGVQLRVSLAALFLFGGCCGKSAQFPLFTWLPDAMAGPTPVSALIHAATMVTSGIYLVVRLNPLFASAPTVLTVIACVGAATALIGGSSALVQRDIKKVLAYSTVSQLGYMFLALGSGAFAAAVFHLVTHAFFKALLFLGAGSVIHGMHDEQDMHKMGGLKAHMPRTFVTFLCGAAALSGLPLMSGFFSKDEILAHTFATGGLHYALWAIGILTAALTAYYTWRMVALTFFGPERFDHHHVHPHESPALMTTPLAVLAVLSVLGGALGLPIVFHAPHLLAGWLEPVTAGGERILAAHHGEHELSHTLEWILLAAGSAIALTFAHLGFHAHKHGTRQDEFVAARRPALAAFLGDAWTIDSTYAKVIVFPLRLVAHVIAFVIDAFAIDGLVNGAGSTAREIGAVARKSASGSLATYALWMGAGAVVLSALWMWS
ncbi:MAG: NADH-quinone oxidoreductase subunit L [Planctomycetes bacterium]|nr:NADH-quinone oxidoreductase subunit L [Planctomycetota bacterium]